jgi:hypothetical protein
MHLNFLNLTREQEKTISQLLDLWSHDLIRAITTNSNKEKAIKEELSRLKFVICDSDNVPVQLNKSFAEAC